VFYVQGGIELGEVGVAAVAEDALHEVQVADQVAGREEADLHRLFRLAVRNLGADRGAQEQGDEHPRGPRRVDRERQRQQILRRIQRLSEQACEGLAGNGLLVAGNGQSALGNVERALGGAPVLVGIVQHALAHPVAGQDLRVKCVPVDGQRQLARHSVPVENECLCREGGDGTDVQALQVAPEEVLDAPVGRAVVVREQPVLLAVGLQQVLCGAQELRHVTGQQRRLPGRCELEIDVELELPALRLGVGRGCAQAEHAFHIHQAILQRALRVTSFLSTGGV
jgi:hypothetical protein